MGGLPRPAPGTTYWFQRDIGALGNGFARRSRSSARPVSASIVSAVLLAALLHALWNSLAHGASDQLVGFAIIGGVDAVGGAVLAAVGGWPPAGVWPLIIASAGLHVLYNALLLASYQLGDFSQMYPLARGTSPWVVALISVTVLGHDLTLTESAGIAAVSAGLIGLVLAGGRPGRRELPALAAASCTGVLIAAYTVVDGIGVTRAPLLAYTGWMFVLQGPPIVLFAALRRGRRLPAALRASGWAGGVGGVVSLAAYTIVLWAQTSGALAPIAALRETSIVFGALIGAVFLGERFGGRRAIASAVVLVGALLLALA